MPRPGLITWEIPTPQHSVARVVLRVRLARSAYVSARPIPLVVGLPPSRHRSPKPGGGSPDDSPRRRADSKIRIYDSGVKRYGVDAFPCCVHLISCVWPARPQP